MARKLRFVPSGSLVEVTCRTVQGRLLLQPAAETRDIIAGVLGRAQRRYPIEVHGIVVMSNHLHLLVTPRDAHWLARFMAFVNGNIARKIGKRVSWRQRFWSRRYTAILVSDEEAAQVGRLRYFLAHGAKEGLVYSPLDWPGVHCAGPLADGSMKLRGTWFDETLAYSYREQGQEPDSIRCSREEVLRLSPLPCWSRVTHRTYRKRIRDLILEIEQETLSRHKKKNTSPIGVTALHRRHPHSTPKQTKRSSAPGFHAGSKKAYQTLLDAYRSFVMAYREAAEDLRARKTACFPDGCFPPRLPFVVFADSS